MNVIVKALRRVNRVFGEMDGEFLDGSPESLARAKREMKIFYLVVAVSGSICAVVIVVLGVLRAIDANIPWW